MVLIPLARQMALIPRGTVSLRDDRKKMTWEADVSSFYLCKFPVTQDLYLQITGDSPSAFKGERNPVECVSWLEAVAFCNHLSKAEGIDTYYAIDGNSVAARDESNGYRLPTDAEWQYACQSGTKGPRYGKVEEIAWYCENSGNSPRPVGLKAPNPWGLYDMLGNVWEWCWDVYDEQVYGTYRVFRGGGWNDRERGCLATNRRRGHPTFKIDDLGFRLARNHG